jgi:di/tricarboxylate transporter
MLSCAPRLALSYLNLFLALILSTLLLFYCFLVSLRQYMLDFVAPSLLQLFIQHLMHERLQIRDLHSIVFPTVHSDVIGMMDPMSVPSHPIANYRQNP